MGGIRGTQSQVPGKSASFEGLGGLKVGGKVVWVLSRMNAARGSKPHPSPSLLRLCFHGLGNVFSKLKWIFQLLKRFSKE